MSQAKKASEKGIPKEGEIQDGELWFSRRGAILTLGLTNRAIDSLGDLEDLGFPEEGDIFDQGDAMVSADGNRGSIELAAPGRGTVLEVNSAASDPDVVSADPLEEGWLVKFQMEDLEELRYLISEAEEGNDSADSDEEADDSDEDEDLDEEEEEEDEQES